MPGYPGIEHTWGINGGSVWYLYKLTINALHWVATHDVSNVMLQAASAAVLLITVLPSSSTIMAREWPWVALQ